MIIHGYVMAMPDDVDTLPDALTSLARFCDHVYVVDGGMTPETLCQHPRYTEPIREWVFNREEFDVDAAAGGRAYWRHTPLILWEHPFLHPADQRNWTLNKMLQESEQPDWIAWIDSDEVCSNEFIGDVRLYLKDLPPDINNICPKWLTLIQDEQHYAPAHSNWLSHARLHHPGICLWTRTWHEHMNYVGRRENWDRYIIHTRMLFRHRLYVQRGHMVVNEGAWANITAEPVPAGVTWQLRWPQDEPLGMPFSADIREYMGGAYSK